MMEFKNTVRWSIRRSIIWDKFPMIEEEYAKHGIPCVCTCGTEGHKHDDPHTHGFAADFRTKNIPDVETKRAILAGIKSAAGNTFYAQLEDIGGDEEHIHFQVRKDLWRTML